MTAGPCLALFSGGALLETATATKRKSVCENGIAASGGRDHRLSEIVGHPIFCITQHERFGTGYA